MLRDFTKYIDIPETDFNFNFKQLSISLLTRELNVERKNLSCKLSHFHIISCKSNDNYIYDILNFFLTIFQ